MTTMQWVGVAVGSLFAILVHWSNERRRREIEERLKRLEDRAR